MADGAADEVVPSTSIPTTTSATTVGATPTAGVATPTTAVGDEEKEQPKSKPGKKRIALSVKKVKKEAKSDAASQEAVSTGEQTLILLSIIINNIKSIYS